MSPAGGGLRGWSRTHLRFLFHQRISQKLIQTKPYKLRGRSELAHRLYSTPFYSPASGGHSYILRFRLEVHSKLSIELLLKKATFGPMPCLPSCLISCLIFSRVTSSIFFISCGLFCFLDQC
jgi:hypothetical protein